MLISKPDSLHSTITAEIGANLVNYTMIHRGLLRQCQTANSSLLFRTRLTTSLPSRRAPFLQTLPQSLNALPSRLCRRYASTEPNGAKPDKDAAAPAQENGRKETPADAKEALREELETKKKEIIDLKVWIHFPSLGQSLVRGVAMHTHIFLCIFPFAKTIN